MIAATLAPFYIAVLQQFSKLQVAISCRLKAAHRGFAPLYAILRLIFSRRAMPYSSFMMPRHDARGKYHDAATRYGSDYATLIASHYHA